MLLVWTKQFIVTHVIKTQNSGNSEKISYILARRLKNCASLITCDVYKNVISIV